MGICTRRRWLGAAALVLAAMLAAGPLAAASAPPQLAVLSPGAVGTLAEQMPLNVVFVGYEPGTGPQDIDVGRLLADQVAVNAGVTRFPAYFGVILPTYTAQFIDYRVRFASESFEDDFFAHLSAIGTPSPLTLYQQQYNQQPARATTVSGNLTLDGPAVEDWLGDHASEIGVDAGEPTVFFVNWFGRPDFQFHVYSRTGRPDTDFGRDFGTLDSRKMIAWGGTAVPGAPRRVWFHDLSAGPEVNTENWDIATADVDGDGVSDYRMPPVWEYGSTTGYRPFTDLSGDLGLLLRYVYVDLLLSPSPLYQPTISAPRLPESFSVDVTRIQANPVPTPLDSAVLTARLGTVQPWHSFRVTQRTIPYSGRIRDVNRCWRTGWADFTSAGVSCFGRRTGGFAFYDMFLYVYDHLDQFTTAGTQHGVPTLLFDVPVSEALPGARAVAEPNYYSGEQFDIASYQVPPASAAGVGQTDTLTHEVGHHLGLSHVHDGLDFNTGRVLQASGDLFFLWTGDESATVMSYLMVANEFGQFDRDNMGRWMTAGYLNQSNQVLARILQSSRSGAWLSEIEAADQHAAAALAAIRDRAYLEAAGSAKDGYDLLLHVADELGLAIEPQARPADDKAFGRSAMFVDPIPPILLARPVQTRTDRIVPTDAVAVPGSVGRGWVTAR